MGRPILESYGRYIFNSDLYFDMVSYDRRRPSMGTGITMGWDAKRTGF
jgi:hypothetical protein